MLGMAAGSQTQWGRIDDDGTVYVRTPDGERAVGSWQAGDASAGLALFVRRFDDLVTEVALLERRLESGAAEPAVTRQHAERLLAGLPTAAAVGDLAGLQIRLEKLRELANEKVSEVVAAREQARAAAIEHKQQLVAEAEHIAAESTSWKAAGDRLRDIVVEWKTIRGVDRKTDDALWHRFAAARDAFGKRRGAHFAGLDQERQAVRQAKERLITEAERLSQSTQWRQGADALKAMMTQWKQAGRASRAEEDALWARFRAAQDEFFRRRAASLAERDAAAAAQLAAREQVVKAAEAIDLTDLPAAEARLRELQQHDGATDMVARDTARRLDERMRRAEERVRSASQARSAAARAQSSPFLVALRERIEHAQAKLDRARASGDPERIARAEAELAQHRALLPPQ